MSIPRPEPPDEIRAAARERAAARADRDFARADALRAVIEGAGWKVVDRGTDFRLEPAAPPTVEEEGVVRYGSAAAVPSLLDERPTARFTVELLAEDWPDDLARALGGLRAHAPAGTQVVIVANGLSSAQAQRLAAGSPDLGPIAGVNPEVVWTSQRLGHAAARNIGLRRARGAIVVLADASVEPVGDALTPLEAAFADPGIGVAGAFGLVTADLRRWEEAPGPVVDALGPGWTAFRRADLAELGPLDEKLTLDTSLDAGWSLLLRAGVGTGSPPRGARRLDLPLVRHEPREPAGQSVAHRDRLAKRDYYRLLERFRDRRDLLSGSRPPIA